MKRTFLFFVLLLFAAHSLTAETAPRKKVAVVLSGGGAKGMAHIGVLKVIEQAGIPIDIITGTSMGSIVGGLYAIGYNAELLDSLVRQQDWVFLLSDRENMQKQSLSDRKKQNTYILSKGFSLKKKNVSGGGIIEGKNLADLFQKVTYGYNDSTDFNQLPIPFACVATDIVTNTEYDFHQGILSQAMRASMAIPGVFAPVRKDDMVLVDGGLRNNFPADIARQMGADYIIGVTVQGAPKTADDLSSTASILSQIVDVNCKNKYDENLSITNVPIRVNATGYSAASFTPAAIDTLIRRGQEEALKHWDELLKLKKELGLPDDYQHPLLTPKNKGELVKQFSVQNIRYKNMTENDIHYIRSKFNLNKKTHIDTHQAELITTAMRVDLFYQTATYKTLTTPHGDIIEFQGGEKKNVQVALGLRFDNEEMASMQINADIPLRSKLPTDIDLTLRLGRRIKAQADLAIHPHNFIRPRLSYIFRRNDFNVYYEGDKDFNITYNQHTFDASVLNFDVLNLNFDIGAKVDFYNYETLLINHRFQQIAEQLNDDHYFTYYARMVYNSENDWYFPDRGSQFYAQYAYISDDLAHMDDNHGISDLSAMWRTSLPINSHFTLQPMFYGRLLFGTTLPYILSNTIGGEWFGRYIEQQMPFAGVGYIEGAHPNFIATQLQAQQRIGTNNYILLRLAAAQNTVKFKELFNHSSLFGTTLAYYYRSPLGPIGGSLGYSNRSDRLAIFINLGFVF